MHDPNSKGPPRKRRTPALASNRGTSKLTVFRPICNPAAAQAQLPIWRWQREAERLTREYLRTGDERWRVAYERHMGGMLRRRREALRG